MIIKQHFTKKPRISFSERLTQAFLEDYQHVDKMMLILLFLHWFTASTIMAYAYGLYTLGFVGGGLVMLIATLAYMLYRGTVVFRIIVGISLMLFSAIFIQQHLGRIEMHFHVFIALAFLIRYKDFIPLLAGAITTTVHHAVFSYCQVYDITLLDMPIKVYNYGEGFSITLLHAAFVVLAVSVYIYMIQSLRQQFIKNIQFSDTLELKNQEIEQSKIALKKEKEREMAANKAKSQFIANMSHELRTPLNAIIGYSEMLRETAEEEARQEDVTDLEKIHVAGNHLLSLINDILDISKIEAGKMEIAPQVFNLPALIEEVAVTAEPLIHKNHNQFNLIMEDDLGEVNTDTTKLRQILLNLLSNASKFCKNGNIDLDVSMQQQDNETWINLIVTDEGIGISEQQLQKLFHAFVQADASTSNQYGGTGLGLVISERFARLMGGRIEVSSEVDKGSCFSVWLPVGKIS